jgi:hypothetical protein
LLITLQITREYQQGEGFNDVRDMKEGMIPNLKIVKREEKNAHFISCYLPKANNQSGATCWLDRLPAEVDPSVASPNSAGESPNLTRVGNGDFSSARGGGWIRRKPEFGPMKRSVRDYAPR